MFTVCSYFEAVFTSPVSCLAAYIIPYFQQKLNNKLGFVLFGGIYLGGQNGKMGETWNRCPRALSSGDHTGSGRYFLTTDC